jgi:hypothetical protein
MASRHLAWNRCLLLHCAGTLYCLLVKEPVSFPSFAPCLPHPPHCRPEVLDDRYCRGLLTVHLLHAFQTLFSSWTKILPSQLGYFGDRMEAVPAQHQVADSWEVLCPPALPQSVWAGGAAGENLRQRAIRNHPPGRCSGLGDIQNVGYQGLKS